MGRLSEAFGFLQVSVKKYNKTWLLHNVTSLSPSQKLYALRKQSLNSNKRLKDEKDN